MCIIALQTNEARLTDNQLKNCWDNNSDGAGIMYADNGKIKVFKELNSFNIYAKEYKRIKKYHKGNIVLHFRIGTSGKMDETNIHPFRVHDSLYFCHNGILNIDVPHNSKINDTQIFNNGILKKLPANFHQDKGILSLLQFTITERNKFVFLDNLDNYTIVNEHKGKWDNGVWYSNDTYKDSKYTYKWDDLDKWDESGFKECECCSNITNYDLKYNKEWDLFLCENCNSFAMHED